jgi:hypothetical protein
MDAGYSRRKLAVGAGDTEGAMWQSLEPDAGPATPEAEYEALEAVRLRMLRAAPLTPRRGRPMLRLVLGGKSA